LMFTVDHRMVSIDFEHMVQSHRDMPNWFRFLTTNLGISHLKIGVQ